MPLDRIMLQRGGMNHPPSLFKLRRDRPSTTPATGICPHPNVDTRRDKELFSKSGPFFQWGLSVSPKEDQLLFSEQEHGQLELMLAENFR